MHPQKLAMYISMLSMTMFFVALTSALLFKKGQDWFSFAPPALFYYSPILVVLNSFLLHRATKLYKSAQFKSFRNHLLLALLSAVGFFLVQWFTWEGILDMRLDRRVSLQPSFTSLCSCMLYTFWVGLSPPCRVV